MKHNVNIYTVDMENGNKELVRETHNLVVNEGLNFVRNGAMWWDTPYAAMRYIGVGTGTTSPTANDTWLETEHDVVDVITFTAGTTGQYTNTSETITFSSSTDVTEAILCNAATDGGSTRCMARVTFAAVTCSSTLGLVVEWTMVLANA